MNPAGETDRGWRWAAAIIAALTIFRLWAASRIGLAPDEAYYWLWSRVPSAGYFDHPPMVAWWIWLSTAVFGNTQLGVRIPAILSVIVTSAAVYATARELSEARTIAGRSALWFNATILVGFGAILISPDSPSVMFWALAVWVLAAIRRTGRGWLWLLVGLFAGLGCISKYTNFFLGLGILLWLLLDPAARRWFLSPWTWLGGLVALLVFLPVLLWNADHNWVSFGKQFGRLAAEGFTLRYAGEFLAAQFGLLNPLIAIFVGIGAWMVIRSQSRWGRPEAFLVALAAPLVVYMLIHSFHARVQGNWLAPLYPGLVLLAAAAAAEKANVRILRGLADLAAPVGIIISLLALGYFVVQPKSVFSLRSPAERVAGWRDLAEAIERLRQERGAGWIATVSYEVTGELAFYGPGAKKIRQIDERKRYAYEPVDAALTQQPALLVVPNKQHTITRFGKCFQSVEPIEDVSRRGPDGTIESYAVLLAKGASPDVLSAGCR